MNSYLKGIWEARYFWQHLAFSDLRSRWRRSFFGVLWSFIQPLGLTLLISVVFSKMFNTDIVTYAPYILSGIIVWDFVISCTAGGSLAFVQADAYIKQCNHPLAIYTLRGIFSNIMVLMLASLSLYAWTAVVLPENINISWLATLTAFPIIALIGWPLATLLAYIGVRFRDVPHIMALVMQSIWFISPVYFEERMFRNGGLDILVDNNPVYHVLELFRAPLLRGEFPTYQNYSFCLLTALILYIFAWLIGRKAERKVIFYL
ncbi:ABC transporter permease [Vibrio qinghaiensis]|uniref:Transport permease protein n=1 Tax=Vibrio qinghaiensis TaxID=2025808 RepID=A0A223N0W2_9VIBR|nr:MULTISPECIES: ABC transporter permease [Vibrio]ASU23346.1 ABC transporter permease [Vibrio qinghaiensis]OEE76866.1 ABC transporter permease [Vibrio ordalii FF-167]